MHTPVLLQQAIENLDIIPGRNYVDATFGEGGYSREIIKMGGKVLAIDLDINQLKNHTEQNKNLKLVQGNFKDIEKIAIDNNHFPVEGIVFDLGLSMRQYQELKKGFSYKKPQEPLDMRLDEKEGLSAKELINNSTVKELYEILAKNSEEIRSKEIADSIKRKKHMNTVGDLVNAIDEAIGYKSSSVYARIFQALRIAVNNELTNLKKGLEGSVNILNDKGRIVIVCFHSLEDRIVKKFVKEKGLKFKEKKPIRGLRQFERSAKLRIILK